MNTTEKYFVEVLRSFVTGQTPQQNTTGIDEKELSSLAVTHNLRGILGYMATRYDLGLSRETVKEFSVAYDKTIMQMIGKETAALALCDILTDNKIPHILFKGITVGECYPVKELRTSGDVDIIIKSEDHPRTRKLLTDMGFSTSITDMGAVTACFRGKEHYEFHTALNVSRIKNSSYFAHIWDNTIPRQGETLMFNHTFHLCYLISHLEKHVYGSGAGAKLYMDIALYIMKHGDEINLEEVRDILTECGLCKFFNTVLWMCHKWFLLDIPQWVEALSEDTYERLCDFTVKNGVFGGQSEENEFNNALRSELNSGKKGAKFRVLMSRVFPPFRELTRIYPKYEKKYMLAPVVWMKHVIDVIRSRKLGRITEIATADTKQADSKKRFLESIGSSSDNA